MLMPHLLHRPTTPALLQFVSARISNVSESSSQGSGFGNANASILVGNVSRLNATSFVGYKNGSPAGDQVILNTEGGQLPIDTLGTGNGQEWYTEVLNGAGIIEFRVDLQSQFTDSGATVVGTSQEGIWHDINGPDRAFGVTATAPAGGDSTGQATWLVQFRFDNTGNPGTVIQTSVQTGCTYLG